MKKILLLSLALAASTSSLVHAEVRAYMNFDLGGTGPAEFGWDQAYPGLFEDAKLTLPSQSHEAAITAWNLPYNYGVAIVGYAAKSNKDGNIFRKLSDDNALTAGKSLYFSFTLSSQKTGGTRFSFAKAGTMERQDNAVLQVRQISSGALSLFQENKPLGATKKTYFGETALVVGFIDYDAGVFKIKVYGSNDPIDSSPKWDLSAEISPNRVYDRIGLKVANQAAVGNIYIGDSWNDVTGI